MQHITQAASRGLVRATWSCGAYSAFASQELRFAVELKQREKNRSQARRQLGSAECHTSLRYTPHFVDSAPSVVCAHDLIDPLGLEGRYASCGRTKGWLTIKTKTV